MTVRKLIFAGLICALALGATPRTASADWLITPFLGGNFGGDTGTNHLNYGASLGFLGNAGLGFEIDLGYAPNFFETVDEFVLTDDSNVTSLMANVLVGAPSGRTRPYASGGIGLMRLQATSVDNFFDVDENSWGLNVGAGVMGFFNDNAGIRGDVRYFRKLQEDTDGAGLDLGSFDLWRATVGVTFRF